MSKECLLVAISNQKGGVGKSAPLSSRKRTAR